MSGSGHDIQPAPPIPPPGHEGQRTYLRITLISAGAAVLAALIGGVATLAAGVFGSDAATTSSSSRSGLPSAASSSKTSTSPSTAPSLLPAGPAADKGWDTSKALHLYLASNPIDLDSAGGSSSEADLSQGELKNQFNAVNSARFLGQPFDDMPSHQSCKKLEDFSNERFTDSKLTLGQFDCVLTNKGNLLVIQWQDMDNNSDITYFTVYAPSDA